MNPSKNPSVASNFIACTGEPLASTSTTAQDVASRSIARTTTPACGPAWRMHPEHIVRGRMGGIEQGCEVGFWKIITDL